VDSCDALRPHRHNNDTRDTHTFPSKSSAEWVAADAVVQSPVNSEDAPAAATLHPLHSDIPVLYQCCTVCGEFMFRSRRSVLAKRLWKSRLKRNPDLDFAPDDDEPQQGIKSYRKDSREVEATGGDHEGTVSPACKVQGQGVESSETDFDRLCSDEGKMKETVCSMLERLEVAQLETLLVAVSGGDQDLTGCVPIPYPLTTLEPTRSRGEGHLRLLHQSVKTRPTTTSITLPPPHLLSCHVWRWPDELPSRLQLKRLPFCDVGHKGNEVGHKGNEVGHKGNEATVVCCNPFHWSRLTLQEQAVSINLADTENCLKGSTSSKSSTIASSSSSNSFTTDDPPSDSFSPGDSRPWCTIAYWEYRRRVGRPFIVDTNSITIVDNLPHGSGMSLALLHQHARTTDSSVLRTRTKVGSGLVVGREPDGSVWLHNRSRHPVFVNRVTRVTEPSPGVKRLSSADEFILTTEVQKVFSGFCLQIFDTAWCDILSWRRKAGGGAKYGNPDGPSNPFCIQVSFAKGFGPRYKRQTAMSCPCWIEVLLYANR